MNVVREINKINERELDLGISGSWHDDYKDSAYIFVGGLHPELTEGDVIAIFSQYGEVMDVNLPRDKETGKQKGFGFLMYEDQRSTILAVDNLNGAKVLERTLRVDHVKNYKQPRVKGEGGEWEDKEEQSLNAKPEVAVDDAVSESSASSGPDIDPEDPMRDYLLAKWKEGKAAKKSKKSKGKNKQKDETLEERRARKERKKEKKLKKQPGKSEGMRAVEQLLNELEGRGSKGSPDRRRRSLSTHRRSRSRSAEPYRRRDVDASNRRYSPEETDMLYRSHSRTLAGDDRSTRRPRSRSHSPHNEYHRDRRASRHEGSDSHRSRGYD